ncbi:RagB/SusD family nutrient uptake outer membrane protein [Cellulophaga sp. HaHaR_3_176]|uniref:RagB/SusD family nutrient uptake outer membrane protein n=1 Tax=Cellulophaga sp. HaHaR_3_176 TaxID=1942464 RepID=UPI001C1F7302|nr:RagB/SusD family nutrient uptake outer membrane protein [Cellulophaga sp. HaHaR_3_176]QWX83475.1 RagB/SusD family nutrient uptake outer membrane protein [Cellulophaga sp. HaHaR_3_176]
MKTQKKLTIYSITFLMLSLLFTSCTDLEEVVLDEELGEQTADPEGVLASAYDRLGDKTFVDHGGVFALQEYTTDIAMLPTRGSDWGDGGKWRSMHEFTWAPDNGITTENWNYLTNGITRSLTAVESIYNSDASNKELFLAEARGLLAFYTYTTLDLYGQAPYRDPYGGEQTIQILQAADAIDDLIVEVEAILPDLAGLGEQSTYNGRFTKEAAYGLLATMYLNRAVFKDRYNSNSSFDFTQASLTSGSNDMEQVIKYTSLLIDSGKFALESNYFSNFSIDNGSSTEMIFAVIQEIEAVRSGDNDFGYVSVARNQRPSPANRGTNAACTTPEFFATWSGNESDPRFSRKYQYGDGTWFMNDGTDVSVPAEDFVPDSESNAWFHFNSGFLNGPQYGPVLDGNGGFIMTSDGRIEVSPLVMEKSTATPMDFTPELNFDNPAQAVFAQNQINRGVRIFKFEYDPENGNGNSKVDIPLYRLGGMFAMRAEAYFRNGQTGDALTDINTLRTSRTRESLFSNAPGEAITTLDETQLYKEIGFELYWELQRRPQMIRFGTFDVAYTAKPATEPFRRIFPIPQETMDVTKQFTQNSGY